MNTPVNKIPVLVIESGTDTTEFFRQNLGDLPVEPIFAITTTEACARLDERPDCAVILSDHQLQDSSGLDFLSRARAQFPEAVRVLMAPPCDGAVPDSFLQALASGTIFRLLSKPFSHEEFVCAIRGALDYHALLQENRRLTQKSIEYREEIAEQSRTLANRRSGRTTVQDTLSSACQNTVQLCWCMLERLNLPLYKHCQRVARLAAALAQEMGCDDLTIARAETAGSLHDLGLLGSNPAIHTLQRSPYEAGREADTDVLLHHPEVSTNYLQGLLDPDTLDTILNHHEYLDGSGYPRGLAQELISQTTAIVSLADYYDEYPLPNDQILPHILSLSGTLFSPDSVRALHRLLTERQFLHTQEKTLLIRELRPGMRLTASVYTTSGMLLVKSGQTLTPTLLDKLLQHEDQGSITQLIFVALQSITSPAA